MAFSGMQQYEYIYCVMSNQWLDSFPIMDTCRSVLHQILHVTACAIAGQGVRLYACNVADKHLSPLASRRQWVFHPGIAIRRVGAAGLTAAVI